ncbi:hypothetical protein F4776DRAFT_676193 [Hypoxylon sp. NC0597]|nr:hypothetical protein F4776DRAFT_676193 [Hypoxylon sp. NC0597]
MDCPKKYERLAAPPPNEAPAAAPVAEAPPAVERPAPATENRTNRSAGLPIPVETTDAAAEKNPVQAPVTNTASRTSSIDRRIRMPDSLQRGRPTAYGLCQSIPSRSSKRGPSTLGSCSSQGGRPTGAKKPCYEQPQGLSTGAFSAKHISFEIGHIGTVNYNNNECSCRKSGCDDHEIVPARVIMGQLNGSTMISPTERIHEYLRGIRLRDANQATQADNGPAWANNAARNPQAEEAQKPACDKQAKK